MLCVVTLEAEPPCAGAAVVQQQRAAAEAASALGAPGAAAVFGSGLVEKPADAVYATVDPIRIGLDGFRARLDLIRKTREPVGLVLSGGSARAFAHIGALKALEEGGIRPDFIVANSMGAIIGLMYAAGFSPDTIGELVSGVSMGSLIDPVMPTSGGFIDAGRFSSFVYALVGNKDIAQLPIPILVLFEDLRTRRQVLMASGALADIMRASFAMPAVFNPVQIGDQILIDGGVTNLVPVSAAAEFSSRIFTSTALYDRAQTFTNPLSVINRAFDIGKTRTAVQEMLATGAPTIRNDVESISFMEFSRPGSIIERGYRSATETLPTLASFVEREAPSPELAAARTRYATLVTRAIQERSLGYVSPALPQTLTIPLLRFADSLDEEWASQAGRRYVGIGWLRRKGAFEGSVGLLAGIGANRNQVWEVEAGLRLVPVRGFGAWLDARLSGAWAAAALIPFDPKAVTLRAGLDYRFGSPRLAAQLGVTAEAGYPLALPGTPGSGLWDALAWTTQAAASFRLRGLSALAASAKLGWYLDSEGRTGPEWQAVLWPMSESPVSFRLRGQGRHGLLGPKQAFPGYLSYRGSLPVGDAQSWLWGSAELVWLAKALEFDAAETIIVKEIEVAPFVDAAVGLASGLGTPSLVAGLSLSASASLMGLSPFELSLSVGKDLMGPGWHLSFISGRLFRR